MCVEKWGGIKVLNNNMVDRRGVIKVVVKVDTFFSCLQERNINFNVIETFNLIF